MTTRPRLTPAIADVRRAVREALAADLSGVGGAGSCVLVAPVLVALSGGPDSLALAAATAFEGKRAGIPVGAVIVDHGLQPGSADVAARAAAQARELGLDPVVVKTVAVGTEGGPEAAARTARYTALAEAADETGATAVLLGHTLDDQAETVLLGLARGSGAASISGMAAVSPASAHHPQLPLFPFVTSGPSRPGPPVTNGNNHSAPSPTELPESRPSRTGTSAAVADQFVYSRPLLGIRRATTVQFCEDSGLQPWTDPHNADASFARVRVRQRVLPVLEEELGPGIAEALARTAEQSREDSEALDHFAEEQVEELAAHAEAGLSLSVSGLAHNPAALRQRIIRLAVLSEFGVSLSRAQTLAVARLVTEWSGQGALDLPGIRVVRQGGQIVFSARAGRPNAAAD